MDRTITFALSRDDLSAVQEELRTFAPSTLYPEIERALSLASAAVQPGPISTSLNATAAEPFREWLLRCRNRYACSTSKGDQDKAPPFARTLAALERALA